MASTMHGTTSIHSSPFPTLDVLDDMRGDLETPFATDPNAPLLEQRARALTDEYWSEMAWLTGMVSLAQVTAVCLHLEADRRSALHAFASESGTSVA